MAASNNGIEMEIVSSIIQEGDNNPVEMSLGNNFSRGRLKNVLGKEWTVRVNVEIGIKGALWKLFKRNRPKVAILSKKKLRIHFDTFASKQDEKYPIDDIADCLKPLHVKSVPKGILSFPIRHEALQGKSQN